MRAQGRRRIALGPNFVPLLLIALSLTALTTYGYAAFAAGPGVSPAEASEPDPVVAPSTSTTSSSTTTSTSTSTTSTTSTTLPPTPEPPEAGRYVVSETEADPEAKQLAVDVAYWLTTYEGSGDAAAHLQALHPAGGIDALTDATRPLLYIGSWSRGEVVYPQMGGLTEERASVMVVVRQTVGFGDEPDFTVVRTLDIRLVRGAAGQWRFDGLASAGGVFASVEELTLAHAVARDPRIEMPDSARLDILAGRVAPELLSLMAEIAERTPYGVAVLATGHPSHVFETNRLSDHTRGRAVDIYRVGDRLVINDRGEDSLTRTLAQWLYDHPGVQQVGSPWDIDGNEAATRSFTDAVHQDHIHVAVVVAEGDDD